MLREKKIAIFCPLIFQVIGNERMNELYLAFSATDNYSILKLQYKIYSFNIRFWATISNMEMIQRFQNKYLGIIVNAPWYVTNDS